MRSPATPPMLRLRVNQHPARRMNSRATLDVIYQRSGVNQNAADAAAVAAVVRLRSGR